MCADICRDIQVFLPKITPEKIEIAPPLRQHLAEKGVAINDPKTSVLRPADQDPTSDKSDMLAAVGVGAISGCHCRWIPVGSEAIVGDLITRLSMKVVPKPLRCCCRT